ncbi:MAG: P-loop NTPase [Fimbriimonadaceae bacterium]|nr:P-loop NTPase [Fimbriimonadaceae bacterium]
MSTRIISVTSGKGGTGKSVVAANLAWALACAGKSTLLIDADTGLANQDILLGVEPVGSLVHAIRTETGWKENSVSPRENLDVIAGTEPFQESATLDPLVLSSHLGRIVSQAPHEFVILDTPSGLSPLTVMFASFAQVSLLVISPEPTSLADGFRLIAAVEGADVLADWKVCLNMAPRTAIASDLLRRFRQAVAGEYSVQTEEWGSIPVDPAVLKAVRQREPLLTAAPKSPAANAIASLASRCANWTPSEDESTSILDTLRTAGLEDKKAA